MHGNENYEGRYKDRPDFGNRKRNLEWRDNWFYLTRPRDPFVFNELVINALDLKRRLIKQAIELGDHAAGYAPAGPAVAGTPWFNIGPRNINGRVKALAVHPTNANIVYAGSASGGVWRSTNAGQSWDPLWDQQESLAIGGIAIARSNPDVIYAGTGEWTPGWGPSYPGTGVYVSTNGGTTWTRRAGVNTARIAQVLVSHTNPQLVYVACDSGFRMSNDGGVNWTTSHTGEISDAVMSPTDANTIYIAVRFDAIYKTTDGGTTWTQLTNGPMGADAAWLRLTIGHTGAHGTNFVASKQDGTIRTSIDGGLNWTALAGSHGGVSYHQWTNLFSAAPNNENILLAAGVGMERTANGGSTWSAISTGGWDHHRAVFAPSDYNIVYMCCDAGMFRSADQGATWRKVSDGLIVTQFYDLGSWETLSNVIGGGAQDNGTIMTTGGLTWRQIWGADGGYFVINPNNPREIYAESQNTALVKSTDGGNNWVGATGGLVGATQWVGVITMDPNNTNRLFCGTDRLFRTLDGCATDWVQVSQQLSGGVSSLAIAPSNTNRVYASTGGGSIYRTDDGGNTNPWADKTAAPLPTRGITDIAVFRTDANRVAIIFGGTNFSGSNANHVFLSTNGGDSWMDISGNLPNITMSAIVFHPTDTNTLYVGTDVGVYRTINGGGMWTAFDNGIPNVIVTDLHVDNEDAALYASTMGRGMYKVSISGTTEPVVDVYLRDSILDTGERTPTPSDYPNPNDTTNQVYWWTSPDIKVEVQPFYTPDAVFDGVEFDNDLVHDDPQRNRTNRFYLQVHNCGWQDATNVRIRAFFTDASAGLPNLPIDFWTAFPTSDPAPNAWQPIGPMRVISTLEPNRPVIVSWDWLVPTSAATHSCLLALITCNEEPLNTTELNIATLITTNKQVCLKNLHVVNSSGPAPFMATINFNNGLPDDDQIDIIFQPSNFIGGSYGLLLPPIEVVNEAEALNGVTVYPLREGEFIGRWYDPSGMLEPELNGLLSTLDLRYVFEFDPAKVSELRGIRLPPGETLHGVVTLLGSRRVETGQSQQFTIMQRQKGEIVGGSTYELRLKRAAKLLPVSRIRVILEKVEILNDHDPWIKGAGDFTFITALTFNDDPCRRQYCRVPQKGNIHISDFPSKNTAVLDVCVFDGLVMENDNMQLSVLPVEEDWLDPDDELKRYSRSFSAPPESWVGSYTPTDETGEDPESLKEWRIWYRVESVRL
ncbi:MAG: hypothetical protein K8L97_07400 [Anaerolineae bacterium]|nr:hypothetical protein [Anaerolineae bacterium]